MKQIIDLSHPINEGMPVYPGTEPPVIEAPCTVEKDGFYERKLSFYSHTGTHIDAPAHLLADAPTLDMLPIDTFVGPGSVIDLTQITGNTGNTGNSIPLSILKPFKNLFETSDFILFHTGWSRYWGQDTYFSGFPVLTKESALWIHQFGLKGIGVDMISVDATGEMDLEIHKILLKQSILIENLVHLDRLPQTGFTFSCLPMYLEAADGSPVRAVAMV
jgi:kynurenine formamidase